MFCLIKHVKTLNKMNKQVTIIGSGFSSLSAACYLALEGHQVAVYEKNDQLGGRARQFVHDGFKFDMGPSWYWMPDVFERFLAILIGPLTIIFSYKNSILVIGYILTEMMLSILQIILIKSKPLSNLSNQDRQES